MGDIKVKKLHENAKIPSLQTTQSAGYDVSSNFVDGNEVVCYNGDNVKTSLTKRMDENGLYFITVPSNTRVMIPTGIMLDIPKGLYVEVHNRSGNSLKKGLQLSNSTGIIDSDYNNELFVLITNTSNKPVVINNHERIAQLIVKQECSSQITFKDKPNTTKRKRKGGMGSTNKKEN